MHKDKIFDIKNQNQNPVSPAILHATCSFSFDAYIRSLHTHVCTRVYAPVEGQREQRALAGNQLFI